MTHLTCGYTAATVYDMKNDITTREAAVAEIARLRFLARQCEQAGLIGATLDNERRISWLKSRWSI